MSCTEYGVTSIDLFGRLDVDPVAISSCATISTHAHSSDLKHVVLPIVTTLMWNMQLSVSVSLFSSDDRVGVIDNGKWV